MVNDRSEIKYNGISYVIKNEDKTNTEVDNVNAPTHYKHGKKETIDVIQDCMTDDEYHGYLKGNVLKKVENDSDRL